MSALRDFQAAFAAALRGGGEHAVAGHLVRPPGVLLAPRVAVYRNNTYASLADALEAAYPAVERLVGPEFFRAAARVFVAGSLPRDGRMSLYGEGFAAFLEGFPPASSVPYLGDVARIERAWLEAFHAAEAEPLDPEALAGFGEHEALDLVLAFHPSLRVVETRHRVLPVWQANRRGDPVDGLRVEPGPETVLLARPAARVEARPLSPHAARLLASLRDGRALGDALDEAGGAAGDPDMAVALAEIIGARVVVAAGPAPRLEKGSEG